MYGGGGSSGSGGGGGGGDHVFSFAPPLGRKVWQASYSSLKVCICLVFRQDRNTNTVSSGLSYVHHFLASVVHTARHGRQRGR